MRADNHRRLFFVALFGGLFLLTLAVPTAFPSPRAAEKPNPIPAAGAGGPIKMARATWDTGWFQAEVYKQLLEELGYTVEGPITMGNREFYQAAANGSADLWVNGWLPGHNAFMEQQEIRSRIEVVGYAVKSGALQGYLVDEVTAQAHGIHRLTDLKDPAIAKLFDRDGNGKADLIGCNVGWGCELVIEHQLEAYELSSRVEHVQGDYSPLMAETVTHYRRGEPILFYTWTPNWTVGTLKPGIDVRWLEVPFVSLPEDQQHLEKQTFVNQVPGCAHDPCAMGFPTNDIRAVVNRDFIAAHPDIRRLLEQVKLSMADISRQNARMVSGEDSFDSIRNHAAAWVQTHRRQVDRWLSEARRLQTSVSNGKERTTLLPTDAPPAPTTLNIVTQRTEPFVVYENRRYTGFTIELWDGIAQKLDLPYHLYAVNTIAKLTDEVRRGAADVAVSGIGITSDREKRLDFSHTFLVSGLQILVAEESGSLLRDVVNKTFSVLLAPELLLGVGLFLLVLIGAAHLNWLFERGQNPQFSLNYWRGIWQSLWWAVVTVTTVGYGDKTPTGKRGRVFGIVWILAGYFVFAYFTATVTSSVTVRELHSFINGPEDLHGKRVATVEKSTAAGYLSDQGIASRAVKTIDSAYRLLEDGQVEAVVYDAPVLQHYARRKGLGRVKVVGTTFQKKSYGFAFPVGSIYRDPVNVALLEMIENGTYQEIRKKWFGN